MESRRNKPDHLHRQTRGTPLPHDYLEMVKDVFTRNFEEGIQALSKIKADPYFQATGSIYTNEIILSVALAYPEQLAATTVHASCDFDPKASSPTAQDLLAICVDAIGSIFTVLLDPKNEEQLQNLADSTLSAFENVPFLWTEVETNRHKVHVKIDKANPKLDEIADEWLNKNDPQAKEAEEREHAKTEELFVTGPKKRGQTH